MNSLKFLVLLSCVIFCSGRRYKCGPVSTDDTTVSSIVTTIVTAGTGESTVSTIGSSEIVCPDCVIGLTDTFVNYIKQMFDNHGPSDGVCKSSKTKISFPGFAFGYNYDMCCCFKVVAPPIDCNIPGQTICPTTPGIGAFESMGHYFNRTAKILENAPDNGCCNFGTVQMIIDKVFSGLSKDACTCIDFTKAIDFSF